MRVELVYSSRVPLPLRSDLGVALRSRGVAERASPPPFSLCGEPSTPFFGGEPDGLRRVRFGVGERDFSVAPLTGERDRFSIGERECFSAGERERLSAGERERFSTGERERRFAGERLAERLLLRDERERRATGERRRGERERERRRGERERRGDAERRRGRAALRPPLPPPPLLPPPPPPLPKSRYGRVLASSTITLKAANLSYASSHEAN